MSWNMNVKKAQLKLNPRDEEAIYKIAGTVDGVPSAYDDDELIEKIAQLLQLRENRMKQAALGNWDDDNALKEFLTPDDLEQLKQAFFNNDVNFFRRFARTVMPIIMERLDYFGFARNVLQRVDLAYGQIPYFDRDVHFQLEVNNLNSRALNYTVQPGGRIVVEPRQIALRIEVPLEEITRLQYDILKRILQKAASMFMVAEDRIFTILAYQNSRIFNPPVTILSSGMRPTFEALINVVRRHGLPVKNLIMHSDQFAEFRREFTSLAYDPLSAREVFLTGRIGTYMGVKVIVVPGSISPHGGVDYRTVPSGMIIATSSPQFVGVMPVRIDPSYFPAPSFNNAQTAWGWLLYEEIGMAIANPLGVAVALDPNFRAPSYLR